eukprot:SAG31_NODE_4211_length_3468_cov_25.898783_1_plen_194_part_00
MCSMRPAGAAARRRGAMKVNFVKLTALLLAAAHQLARPGSAALGHGRDFSKQVDPSAELARRARSLIDTRPAEGVRLLQQRASRSDCPAETADDAELLGDCLAAAGWLPEAAAQFLRADDLAAMELSAADKQRKKNKATFRAALEHGKGRQARIQLKLARTLVQIQTAASIEQASAPISSLMRQSDGMSDEQR